MNTDGLTSFINFFLLLENILLEKLNLTEDIFSKQTRAKGFGISLSGLPAAFIISQICSFPSRTNWKKDSSSIYPWQLV